MTAAPSRDAFAPARLIAVPNVSEGRDSRTIEALVAAASGAGARVLDRHSDPHHNRSVLTLAGATPALIKAAGRLAVAAADGIDLTRHSGLHPCLGSLDVWPFVPHLGTMEEAIDAAKQAAETVAERAQVPVFLYGAAATRPETKELPDLRRGGAARLARRIAEGLQPDAGPTRLDPTRGVVCVGARGPLIAFNVVLGSDEATARSVASSIRERSSGLAGVRALGFALDSDLAQVSMNLTDPDATSVSETFEAVAEHARGLGVEVISTEIVGLPPDRYLPTPQTEAARLMDPPGRSLESSLT